MAILKARMPEVEGLLARQIIGVVQALRKEDLEKKRKILVLSFQFLRHT